MNPDKHESMTRRSLTHDVAAIVIMGFYGGQVCPFVDNLDLGAWFLELTIIFGIIVGIRLVVAGRIVNSLPANRQVAGQFWFELGVYLFIGAVVTAINLLLHGFPMESGLKMVFGVTALGFFKGMDMGLARERLLATQFTTGTFDADVEGNFYPITRKFAVFATLTAVIVTTVIVLVLFKDVNWLLNTPSLDPNEAKMAVLQETVFIAAVFLAYIVNLIFSYSHNLKRLVDEENRALMAVSEGDLSHLVTVSTNDEFGIMGRYTNQMIRELDESRRQLEKAHNKLVESERLRAIGEFASSIVHEIRSPLHVVQMMLDFFDKQELADGGRKRLKLARTEVTRLTGLMSEILLYAKPQRLEREELDLAEALVDWIDAFEALPSAGERQIELHLSGQPVWIRADPDKVKQALINLVSNACEAAPKGESVRVHLDNNEDVSHVEVRNNGTPIPPEQLPRLTEPFFTTKQSGTGLGLAIVKRIMDAHEGLLSVTSSATAGTRVALSFPGRAGAARSGTDGRTRAPASSYRD